MFAVFIKSRFVGRAAWFIGSSHEVLILFIESAGVVFTCRPCEHDFDLRCDVAIPCIRDHHFPGKALESLVSGAEDPDAVPVLLLGNVFHPCADQHQIPNGIVECGHAIGWGSNFGFLQDGVGTVSREMEESEVNSFPAKEILMKTPVHELLQFFGYTVTAAANQRDFEHCRLQCSMSMETLRHFIGKVIDWDVGQQFLGNLLNFTKGDFHQVRRFRIVDATKKPEFSSPILRAFMECERWFNGNVGTLTESNQCGSQSSSLRGPLVTSACNAEDVFQDVEVDEGSAFGFRFRSLKTIEGRICRIQR